MKDINNTIEDLNAQEKRREDNKNNIDNLMTIALRGTAKEYKWICKDCGLKIKDKHQLLRHSYVKCRGLE